MVATATGKLRVVGATIFAVEFFVDYGKAHEWTIEVFWHYINDSKVGRVDFFRKIWYN